MSGPKQKAKKCISLPEGVVHREIVSKVELGQLC